MGRASRDGLHPLRRWLESTRPPGRCAQAPQMRGDNEGCAAGLAPRALLFASPSPARKIK